MLHFDAVPQGSMFVVAGATKQEPFLLHTDGKLYLYTDLTAGPSITWVAVPEDALATMRGKNPPIVIIRLDRFGQLQHTYAQSQCASYRQRLRTAVHVALASAG